MTNFIYSRAIYEFLYDYSFSESFSMVANTSELVYDFKSYYDNMLLLKFNVSEEILSRFVSFLPCNCIRVIPQYTSSDPNLILFSLIIQKLLIDNQFSSHSPFGFDFPSEYLDSICSAWRRSCRYDQDTNLAVIDRVIINGMNDSLKSFDYHDLTDSLIILPNLAYKYLFPKGYTDPSGTFRIYSDMSLNSFGEEFLITDMMMSLYTTRYFENEMGSWFLKYHSHVGNFVLFSFVLEYQDEGAFHGPASNFAYVYDPYTRLCLNRDVRVIIDLAWKERLVKYILANPEADMELIYLNAKHLSTWPSNLENPCLDLDMLDRVVLYAYIEANFRMSTLDKCMSYADGTRTWYEKFFDMFQTNVSQLLDFQRPINLSVLDFVLTGFDGNMFRPSGIDYVHKNFEYEPYCSYIKRLDLESNNISKRKKIKTNIYDVEHNFSTLGILIQRNKLISNLDELKPTYFLPYCKYLERTAYADWPTILKILHEVKKNQPETIYLYKCYDLDNIVPEIPVIIKTRDAFDIEVMKPVSLDTIRLGKEYCQKDVITTVTTQIARYAKEKSIVPSRALIEMRNKLRDIYVRRYLDTSKIRRLTAQDISDCVHKTVAKLRSKGSEFRELNIFLSNLPETYSIFFFLKQIVKAIPAKSNGVDKPGQGISAWSKALNAIFCPIFMAIEDALKAALKDHVLIENGVREADFDKFVADRYVHEYEHYVADYTQYDEAQNADTQMMEDVIIEIFCPIQMIDIYRRMRLQAVQKSFACSLINKGSKNSGESATLSTNGKVNDAITCMSTEVINPTLELRKGDDLYINAEKIIVIDLFSYVGIPKPPMKRESDFPKWGDFVGFYMSSEGIIPDIIRYLMKVMSKDLKKSERYFNEIRLAIADKSKFLTYKKIIILRQIYMETYKITAGQFTQLMSAWFYIVQRLQPTDFDCLMAGIAQSEFPDLSFLDPADFNKKRVVSETRISGVDTKFALSRLIEYVQ